MCLTLTVFCLQGQRNFHFSPKPSVLQPIPSFPSWFTECRPLPVPLLLTAFQNGNRLRIDSIFSAPQSLWVRTAPVNLKPRQMVIHLWQSMQTREGLFWNPSAREERRLRAACSNKHLRCGASLWAQQSTTRCAGHKCHSPGGQRL